MSKSKPLANHMKECLRLYLDFDDWHVIWDTVPPMEWDSPFAQKHSVFKTRRFFVQRIHLWQGRAILEHLRLLGSEF